MANIKGQLKRIRQDERRRERNKAVRSELKTRVKRALQNATADDGEQYLRAAIQRLDKAAKKGIIHPNQAARRKSRLMRAVNRERSATEA
ncbi:ribosomal protein S20 [Acidimicrobium ferrooxidans DSM 10331]|uniref:Small ribosomal subunit protein bS20 n=1 Tax=Acidimicrobium ferrooxidans (strain DSM 10331 / JCM 15462 / NBRC 103882 / ICP) TaxID=525909 RepID=C7LZR7_ACIFD|nr:30S ribosomal protein S20 [Acidimicrobium ferrooxidans]ACU54225.1 ribosomal protein S20 [Acidimicrobium ferrooxidans DSM 10331]